MAKPVRIQLRRTKGWRMPPNTVKVTRGKGAAGKWGNPFKIEHKAGENIFVLVDTRTGASVCASRSGAEIHNAAVAEFRHYARSLPTADLRGKNLGCWCRPGDPCHADVLLELANG